MIFPKEIMEQVGVRVIKSIQPNGVKSKMKERKIINGEHWKESLKQRGARRSVA